MTAYLSSASAFSNLDERVNECYPLLCCLPAGGEPPANFVPLAEHNCPFADGTQDPAYGCQYREFCSLILPIFYGAIGYMAFINLLVMQQRLRMISRSTTSRCWNKSSARGCSR